MAPGLPPTGELDGKTRAKTSIRGGNGRSRGEDGARETMPSREADDAEVQYARASAWPEATLIT